VKHEINILERQPIWIALSEFYLDTELQESTFEYIAFKIIESPYDFEKIKNIDKYEVFPVLKSNLMSPAGEWVGFDDKWLIERITESLNKRHYFNKKAIEKQYLSLKWMRSDYWIKLEAIYNRIK